MKLGMITCNFFAGIYNYNLPENMNWGEMCNKYYNEFSEEDLANLMEKIHSMGVDYVELWEPHATYKRLGEEDAVRIRGIVESKGLTPYAYCIGGWGKNDLDIIERGFEFAKGLGSKVITGCIGESEASKVIAKIGECAEKYDIRYAIENHPKPSLGDPKEIMEVLKSSSKYIGANIDAGIYYQEGYDILEAAKLFEDRIYHVHFKDTVRGQGGCAPIGEGNAPLAELAAYLKQIGYKDMISIEWEQGQDPTEGLKKAVEYSKGII